MRKESAELVVGAPRSRILLPQPLHSIVADPEKRGACVMQAPRNLLLHPPESIVQSKGPRSSAKTRSFSRRPDEWDPLLLDEIPRSLAIIVNGLPFSQRQRAVPTRPPHVFLDAMALAYGNPLDLRDSTGVDTSCRSAPRGLRRSLTRLSDHGEVSLSPLDLRKGHHHAGRPTPRYQTSFAGISRHHHRPPTSSVEPLIAHRGTCAIPRWEP
jgi:hypothetical protein